MIYNEVWWIEGEGKEEIKEEKSKPCFLLWKEKKRFDQRSRHVQKYIFVTVKNVIWGEGALEMETSGQKDRNVNFSVKVIIMFPASRSPVSKTSVDYSTQHGENHYSASKIKH